MVALLGLKNSLPYYLHIEEVKKDSYFPKRVIVISKEFQTEPFIWFFQVVAMSVLLYGCTTWSLMKCLNKKLYENYKNAALNQFWGQHPAKQQLYSHLPPIAQAIKIWWKRHCLRSKDELVSNVLLWTPTQWHTSVGWSAAKTYIYQIFADIGYCLEELPRVMAD